MLLAGVAQVIEALGSALGDLDVDFAIEQAQRIALEPLTAILAELREMSAAVLQHHLPVTGTALSVAQRIDLEIQLQIQGPTQLVDHDHQLSVGRCVGPPENLDSKLRKLTKA